MDASEVAISLIIVRLHDLYSKSKDIKMLEKLRNQIPESISNLQTILNTRKNSKLNDGQNQDTLEAKIWLLLLAHRADQIAEELLAKMLRDQISESQNGHLAKVCAVVRFFSAMNRVHARKKMAKEFITMVGLLSSKLRLLDNKRASSSSSSKRNQENTKQRFESDIVERGEVKKLLAWLTDHRDDHLRVISVVGDQACGKTALVRGVFSRPEIKRHFDCRAWVHVMGHGVESDWMKNLLVDILKQVPLKDQPKDMEHKKEEQLFQMLHKSLMERQYLIVLDNFCKGSVINELLVPFVDSKKGSRVIITTTVNIQKYADPWTHHLPLGPLTPEECKKLLRVSIKVDDDLDSEMTNLEGRILSKCNGHPPAISLLGGLLSAVEESNWETLINRLGDRPTLDNILSLSFDELPFMMKSCILYLALFPEESMIPKRRLFRQWAAEGLLEEPADSSVQMPSAEDCLLELERRNLILVVQRKLDGSVRSCRVPAFLHEFLCWKAKKFGLLKRHSDSDSVPVEKSRVMGTNDKQNKQDQRKQAENAPKGHHGYKVQWLRSFASFSTRKLETKGRQIDLFKSPITGGTKVKENSKLGTKAREREVNKLPILDGSFDTSAPGEIEFLLKVPHRSSILDGCFNIHKLGTQAREMKVLINSPNLDGHVNTPNVVTRATGIKVVLKVVLESLDAQFNPRQMGTRARETELLLESPLLAGCPDLLRVLDLEGVYQPVLPKDFGNTLSNLRYLGLRWTALESIPESVGNLLLLETLDLKHTNITKVTGAIWNAKNLRHLYLSEALFDKPIPRHIISEKSPNTKLETLWGLFIEDEKSPMIRVLKNLQSLKKLGVTCSPRAVEKVKESVSKLARLESLRLRSRDMLGQPAMLDLSNTEWPESLSDSYLLGSLRSLPDLSSVLPNLKVLTLSMSELQSIKDLEGLKHLVVLRLLARSCTSKELSCRVDSFPELRVLKLWMLEELKQFDIEEGAMSKLKELEIRQCENLEKVDGLQHIGSLETVSLTGVQEELVYYVKVPQDIVNKKELILKGKRRAKTLDRIH